ncbi:hypothetical protein, partial [Mesorhizobium sp.]|uniref:hypothetical protein n=1 Tax=Mesorhizobium sp. TaxID=1871066 RepID=UPI0025C572FB
GTIVSKLDIFLFRNSELACPATHAGLTHAGEGHFERSYFLRRPLYSASGTASPSPLVGEGGSARSRDG